MPCRAAARSASARRTLNSAPIRGIDCRPAATSCRRSPTTAPVWIRKLCARSFSLSSLPRTGVGAFVNAVAIADGALRLVLAGAQPDRIGVVRIDGDAAERVGAAVIEDRSEEHTSE